MKHFLSFCLIFHLEDVVKCDFSNICFMWQMDVPANGVHRKLCYFVFCFVRRNQSRKDRKWVCRSVHGICTPGTVLHFYSKIYLIHYMFGNSSLFIHSYQRWDHQKHKTIVCNAVQCNAMQCNKFENILAECNTIDPFLSSWGNWKPDVSTL